MESTERTRQFLTVARFEGDRLHERFHRLRVVIQSWERRIAELPDLAVELFEREDLAGIGALLDEKRLLQERIRLMRGFVQKWENPGFETILGVPKSENEQRRDVFP